MVRAPHSDEDEERIERLCGRDADASDSHRDA
jgi:hypothetical protein